jgi:hypothetical protein
MPTTQDLLSTGMAGRSDSRSRYAAHRDALTNRLLRATRIRPESEEHFVRAWESEAASRGLDLQTTSGWQPAWEWIVEHRWMASRAG